VYLIREKQRLFKNYFELRKTFDERGRDLLYLRDSTAFRRDSLQWAQDSALYAAKREQEEAFGGGERDDGRRDQTRRSPDGRDQGRFDQAGAEEDEGPGPKPELPKMEEDTIATLRAKAAFELGNLFFTELDVPDSAKHYYRLVVDEHSGSEYHASTLYALGSYYLTQEREDKADSLFRYIYENYPDDRIVNAAAAKIGKPLIDFDYDPAEELFLEGEDFYLAERYDSALATFFETFRLYPESDYSAKALYTAGWILEDEFVMNDSAAAVYDTLLARFPFSDYSTDVMPKLDAYKKDIEAKEKRIQDSLQAIQDSLQAIEDSVRAADSLLTVGSDSLVVADSLVVPDSTSISDSVAVSDDPTKEDSLKLKEIPVFEEEEDLPKLKMPEEIDDEPELKRDDGDGDSPEPSVGEPPAPDARQRRRPTG
jgi:TolA-binding protein